MTRYGRNLCGDGGCANSVTLKLYIVVAHLRYTHSRGMSIDLQNIFKADGGVFIRFIGLKNMLQVSLKDNCSILRLYHDDGRFRVS